MEGYDLIPAPVQNQDMLLRTNVELVRVVKVLGGSNAVDTLEQNHKEDKHPANYTFAHLHLFKDEARNLVRHVDGSLPTLHINASAAQAFLSRAAVDYLLNELNLEPFIAETESSVGYGKDENIFGTINANDEIRITGGFTQQACRKKRPEIHSLVRWVAAS